MVMSVPPTVPATSPVSSPAASASSYQQPNAETWNQALNDASAQSGPALDSSNDSTTQAQSNTSAIQQAETQAPEAPPSAQASSPTAADNSSRPLSTGGTQPAKKHVDAGSDSNVSPIATMVLSLIPLQDVPVSQTGPTTAGNATGVVKGGTAKSGAKEAGAASNDTTKPTAHASINGSATQLSSGEGQSEEPKTQVSSQPAQAKSSPANSSGKPAVSSNSGKSLATTAAQASVPPQVSATSSMPDPSIGASAPASSPSSHANAEMVSVSEKSDQPATSLPVKPILSSPADEVAMNLSSAQKGAGNSDSTQAGAIGVVTTHSAETVSQATNAVGSSATAPLAGQSTVSLAPTALAAAVMAMHQGGQSTAILRLDPPDLGSLTVHLTMQNGQVNVLFTPSSAQTGQLLHANLDNLRQSMASAGLNLGQADVGQGGAGNPGGQQQGGQNTSGSMPQSYASAEYGVTDGQNNNGALAYA
jgi:flagellar hook-length control protein FliK